MKQFTNSTIKLFRGYWWILTFLAIYYLVINLVVLNRHWQFETTYFDHGIFDSAVWQVSQGKQPLIDHLQLGQIPQYVDHFTPSLYLLVPVYWFTKDYEAVFLLLNLMTVASAFVLFLIAKEKIKSNTLIFSLIFAYCFYQGTQNNIIGNFHTEAIAVLTLSLALYAFVIKRWKLFWVFVLLTIGAKENFASIFLGFGLFLIFQRNFKQGLSLIVFSLLAYLGTTLWLIPQLSGRPYYYAMEIPKGMALISRLFDDKLKLQTVFYSLLNFGFLPLLIPAFWPVIIQDFFGRFVLNTYSIRWDLGMHYNATLAVLLTFSSILSAEKIEKIINFKHLSKIFAIFIIGTVVVLHRFILRGPLALAYNPDFYKHTAVFDFERKFLSLVPKAQTTMTQNNLGAYLTHQTQVYLLRPDYWNVMPDQFVFDLRPGQNPNYFFPMRVESSWSIIKTLESDPNYTKRIYGENMFIFTKKPSTDKNWYDKFANSEAEKNQLNPNFKLGD